jgi:3-oxoacyl-[acyl-carrier protein] reductase
VRLGTDCWAAKAKQVTEDINKSGGKSIAVPGDMLDAEYIKTLVKKAAEFGNGKIHIIVNNAGSASNTLSTLFHC